MTLAQRGDRRAFDELAERHATPLRRLVFRITRDCEAAYDAVQEALTRAWTNIARFEGRAQFSTWLTRIGINEARRILRRTREEPLERVDLVGDRVPGRGSRPEEIVESHEFLRAVDRALAELPPDHRTAVTLRDVEGLSTSDAAEVLGIGERALKSRVHRGRMALRARLDPYLREGYA
ncbi:MAG: RNA polymerase sigma factor [Thermoleophilia bacterium]